MGFFSAEVADALQLVTFPLEMIGLALATIEVRYPLLAARIAGVMDELTERIRAVEAADQMDGADFKRLWGRGEHLAAV